MKFTTIASASLLSFAAAESIKLEVIGDDQKSQGFLSSIHEGAGINYALVSLSGQSLTFEDSAIYFEDAGYKYNLGYSGDFLALGPAVSLGSWSFNQIGVLATKTFLWACNNVNDPYDYSSSSKLILSGDNSPNDSCSRITLQKAEDGSSSSDSASTTSSSWTNGTSTTTEWQTVTDYTTYCPESTTITVTTCDQNKCGENVITVTEATTVVVTGECVVPVTPTPSPATTTPAQASSSSTPASSSPALETPAVTTATDNGAAKVGAGIAGFAGVAAAFLI